MLDGYRTFEAIKLSVGCMLVLLPVELAMDQPVRVELTLGGDTFRSRAHVVFLGPDSERTPEGMERFRVGLAFVDPSPADRAKVERYIEDTLLLAP